MIDLRQLAFFVAVVEAKSLTSAAEVLHVAQPALSQHLQRLEHEFGQQLLVRHSRGVEPTAAGLRLVEHARAILTAVETAKEDIRNFEEHPHGHVRVGMPRSLCDAIAFDLMATWPKEHPRVSLQIVEQPSNTLAEWVLQGRLDVAVSSFPSDSRLLAEPLVQDKLCAVMPKNSKAAGIGKIRLTDLVKKPLILYGPSNISRQLIDMTAKYSSLELNVAYEVDSPDLALRLVEAGYGSTIQPYLAVRNHMKSKRTDVKLITAPSITRRLHLIRSRHRTTSVFEMQMCDAIKDLLAKELRAGADASMVELDFAAG